jgi:hypothetical protein
VSDLALAALGAILVAAGLAVLIVTVRRGSGNDSAEVEVSSVKLSIPTAVAVMGLGIGCVLAPRVFSLIDSDDTRPDPPSCAQRQASEPANSSSTNSSGDVSGGPVANIFTNGGDPKPFVYLNGDAVVCEDFIEARSCHRGSRPVGLRLRWNMEAGGNPSGGWGIRWDTAPDRSFDAAAFSSVLISVKGVQGDEEFQVGLRDAEGHEEKVESKEGVLVSPDEWRDLVVDFDDFPTVDVSQIVNLNLGFNTNHDSGEICIDQITFVP